jgi:protocatechuate 3,4-dioxygenase beta subunit
MPSRAAYFPSLLALVASVALAQAAGQAGPPPGAGAGQGPPQRGGQVTPPRDPSEPAAVPRGTAIIRGIVVAADTGTPIRRAQVRAAGGSGGGLRLATTDAQGRFEFKELVAGRFNLFASKGGFVSLQYGQRRPSEAGTPIDLSDKQVIDKLLIALPRGSVIAGRIFDEFGEPVANAVVTAMRYGYSGGVRRILNAGGQNSRDTTDDQGAFRLFGLQPGEYVIAANFRGGGPEITDTSEEISGFAPTYFPGTPNAGEAQRVRVDVSQEQSGVNFALIAAKLVRIGGSIINSQGAVVTNASVTLVPGDRSSGPLMTQSSARVNRSGTFQLNNVPPGRYVLQVRTAAPGGRGGPAVAAQGPQPADVEFGRLDLAVGAQDLDGVVVVTAPGARLTGQVVADNQQPLPFRPEQVQLAARAARADQAAFPGGGGGTTRPASDWTFQIIGLFDPVLLRVNNAQGWSLKRVLLNGQDVTDTPLEFTPGQTLAGLQVVLSDKSTLVQGAVTDDRGNLMTDATVLVFPSDEARWSYQSRFIRSGRPNQDGRYEIRGLPPLDDYLIVAVQGLEDGQAGDPEFLARVKPLASRLALNDGETKTADVKLPVR